MIGGFPWGNKDESGKSGPSFMESLKAVGEVATLLTEIRDAIKENTAAVNKSNAYAEQMLERSKQ